MRDRRQEVAEVHWHLGDRAEYLAGIDELLLGCDVFGPLLGFERHGDKRNPRLGADAIFDRSGKVVTETHTTEIRQDHPFDGVIAAFECCGQAKSFVVVADEGFT